MKKFFSIFVLLLILSATSCQTRLVSNNKPLQPNSLELYEKYTILTNDAKEYKAEILKQDETQIYIKNKQGEEIVIEKSNIREVKKVDLLSTIAIGLAAIAAVIFVPI
ncbi:bacteriophage spanin2 family protein [Kaistella sp. G5-32]|uniref:Bacteriophage spanin2 family protein n=1 Tax=Kaistella gelatinilytica TaxID=2787636 RepID=A0ABS0FDN4_9FLAO|nr:bacteriophage spanin2 family protein [Kaistella gelatinilytica]MBF8457833.1 bacteriophage spanin2 family protein [Kaistella gelatinilytica]